MSIEKVFGLFFLNGHALAYMLIVQFCYVTFIW